MKKIIALLLVLLMLCALLASCKKDVVVTPEVTEIEKYETALIGDWQDYTLVYPDEASTTVSNAFSSLRTALTEKYGVSLPVKTDFKLPYEEVPVGTLEILVGETNREESIAARNSIKANDFIIEYSNGRIVIVGGSDEYTAKAVDHVIEYLLQDDGFNVPASMSFAVRGDYAIGNLTINGVDIREFQIVRGKGMNANERLMTEQLTKAIATVCGYKINVVMPTDAEKKNEILIGDTGRPETTATLAEGTYSINQTSDKLALFGNGTNSSAFVIKYLVDYIFSIEKCDSFDIKLDNVSGVKFTSPSLTATNLPEILKNYAENPEYNIDFMNINNVLDKFNVSVNEFPDEITVLDPVKVEDYPFSLKTQIFVAPDGNDSNPGTIDAPMATVNAALKLFSNEGGGVIWLRGGTYNLDKAISVGTLHNGSILSPMFIAAYEDETPILTTAKSLNPADFSGVDYASDTFAQRIPDDAKPHIAVVNLYELGWTKADMGEISTKTAPKIYINGEETFIARYPNAGEPDLYFDQVLDTGSVTSKSSSNLYNEWIKRVASGEFDDRKDDIYIDSYGNKNIDHGWTIRLKDYRPFEWENAGNILFYGNVFEGWDYVTCQIKEFNLAKGSMTSVSGTSLGAKHSGNSPTGYNTYYFYNIIEELDSVNEWYLDYETGNLYIYAGNDFDTSEILFNTKNVNVINLTNASNIVVDGITVAASFNYGIYAEGCDQVVIQNCTVYNTASQCIAFKNTLNSAIIYNDVSAAGGGLIGIAANSTQYTLQPMRNIIQNNYLHDTLKNKQGGISVSGALNVVSHNYLEYCQIGISMSCENIIEYNELKGGSKDTSDAGLIYLNGYFNFGNHIRYNYMHTWANAGKAIYFDDLACRNYAYYNLADTTGGEFDTVNMLYSSSGHYNVFVGNICIGRSTDYVGESCLYFTDRTSLGYRWVEHSAGFITSFTTRYDLAALYKRFPEFEAYIDMMKTHVNERSKADYVRNENEIYLRSPAHNVYMNNLLLGVTSIKTPIVDQTNSVTGEKMTSLTLVKDNFTSKNIDLFMPGYLDNDYTIDASALSEIKSVITNFYMPDYEHAGLTYELAK